MHHLGDEGGRESFGKARGDEDQVACYFRAADPGQNVAQGAGIGHGAVDPLLPCLGAAPKNAQQQHHSGGKPPPSACRHHHARVTMKTERKEPPRVQQGAGRVLFSIFPPIEHTHKKKKLEKNAPAMAAPEEGFDVLFQVRNALYIGNYQVCINEAQKLKAPTPEIAEEKDVLMYRAMVAQGKYAMVKGDITSSSSSALQAVKRLALYLHKPTDKAAAVEEAKKQMDDGMSLTNPTVALVNAMIFMNEERYDDGLRCLHQSTVLDNMALAVQIMLKMDRVDLARKELKRMQGVDEDSTITQLSLAWVNLASGGEKLQEAYYIFQEMADKFGPTPTLLNGQAACYMLQGKYDDVEGLLQTALEKDSGNPETLINLASVTQFLGKAPEVSQRYINQLVDTFPKHPFVVALHEKEEHFGVCASQFEVPEE
eukprot:m.64729 g.64729  ORF g.64729 m.64729 type:complete len:427 (+) comp16447_c1_seq1:1801-3081(+)